MTDTPTSSAQGRFIRAALVIFPVGTVVFGILSFGIWWWKRERVEERGYKYALALRRDLSEAGLRRHADILAEALRRSDAARFQAVAAYLESSMGAENMGYQVRRDRSRVGESEVANIDVELTGKPRPREVVLLLVPYGEAGQAEAESRSLAMLMSLAHALTGETRSRTLRFAAVPLGADPEALARLAEVAESRRERIMQVFVLGGGEAAVAAVKTALQAERSGALVKPLSPPETLETALTAAGALRTALLEAAE
jgi:hypothetical protein